jgi:hypothetical protein
MTDECGADSTTLKLLSHPEFIEPIGFAPDRNDIVSMIAGLIFIHRLFMTKQAPLSSTVQAARSGGRMAWD